MAQILSEGGVKPTPWNIRGPRDPRIREEWRWAWEDLVFIVPAWEGGGGPRDVFAGRQGTLVGDTTWRRGPKGREIATNGSADRIEFSVDSAPGADLTSLNTATMLAVSTVDGTPNQFAAWMSCRTGSAHQSINVDDGPTRELTFSWDDASEEYRAETGLGGWTAGNIYLLACSIRPGGVDLWRFEYPSGPLEHYSDTNTNNTQDVTGTWSLSQDTFADGRSIDGGLITSGLWTRPMVESEIRHFIRGPFGSVRPRERIIVSVSDGDATPISATLAGSSTDSAAITSTDSLTSSLTGTSTDSGAVTSSAAVSATMDGTSTDTVGTVILNITATTTLAGTSSDSGSITSTDSISSTLAGVSDDSGTISFAGAMQIAATMAGTSVDSGSITSTSDLGATLVGGSADTGAISSTAAVLATLAGTSTDSGSITSTASITSTLTGTSTDTGSVSRLLAVAATLAGTSLDTATISGIISEETIAILEDEMAGTLNYTVEQGARFADTLTYKNGDGNPIDLSGYSVRMQIREKRDRSSALIHDLADEGHISISDASGGEISIDIPDETTRDFSFGTAYYDLEIDPGSGDATRLMQGRMNLSREVTD